MPKTRGFTLLELLLASVLMAVLMVGVMSVIANVVRPAASLADNGSAVSLQEQAQAWVRVLHADLGQARMIKKRGDEVVVMNTGGIDPLTQQRTHRPVIIRYAIKKVGERSCLVRYEQSLDTREVMPERRELVGIGVTRLELVPPAEFLLEPDASHQSVTIKNVAEKEKKIEPPIDGLWTLKLWTDLSDRPTIERGLAIRRSLKP